ncbi:alpha/beta hydrolase [Arthrobacter sp. I2-34]|uniref:Alpha/beta hydrolase n=1 Tax=Arthrobacter hankyongi TaxID=2904801 RepID=A0ABS9L8L4_9MICC|nr:alpha/beta hydrolase [Arthrobacter hankyongi]MCG2622941.1 alpha/beta hydrolase [Arthrobacter hankyongi]
MPRSRRSTGRALIAGAAALAALLAGCSAPASTGQATADVTGEVAEGLRPYYEQQVHWKRCEGRFECADIEVPMDYADPGGKRIKIAAIRTTGGSQGSILVNPGGPGASGYDFVRDGVDVMTTDKLRGSYSIVGFDPRGIKRSAPVTCLTDKEQDAAREESYDIDSDQGIAQAVKDATELGAKCAEKTGPVLGHVDTLSATKDLDILRAALGQAKLDYLGWSYGTFLGAQYAELFPERVGRLVLDGALDPALDSQAVTLGQAKGFEQALRSYVESCLAGSGCPLSGSADEAVAQVRDLIRSVEASPLTAQDGRLVPVNTFVSGLITPLYDEANWPALTLALTSALQGDPTQMLWLADQNAQRDPDGHYTGNTTFAFTAVNCLDYPMASDLPTMRKEAAELEQASPTFGRYLAYGGTTCENWPYKPVRKPAPVKAEGAAPIVVIGTTGDPATPYAWAESLADQLSSASLVTFKGEGHTAYRSGANSCIKDAVDNYFVDGKVPADGTKC